MNNQPHKKEKAKKRSKEYFVKKAVKVVHYAVAAVHSETSKTVYDAKNYMEKRAICQDKIFVCVSIFLRFFCFTGLVYFLMRFF